MSQNRVRDYVVYIAIGLAAVAVLTLLAWNTSAGSSRAFFKWLGLAFSTAIVFGYAIQGARRDWNYGSLWTVIGLALAIHLVTFWWVLSRFDEWRLIWYVPTSLVEAVAIRAACTWAVGRFGNRLSNGGPPESPLFVPRNEN
ncbi:MAG: hypothetical protein P4K98_09015 [Bryobacteraceae bacterium]|nr:hypothetical protein [Bryobacteraceae bacterium]